MGAQDTIEERARAAMEIQPESSIVRFEAQLQDVQDVHDVQLSQLKANIPDIAAGEVRIQAVSLQQQPHSPAVASNAQQGEQEVHSPQHGSNEQ